MFPAIALVDGSPDEGSSPEADFTFDYAALHSDIDRINKAVKDDDFETYSRLMNRRCGL